MRDKLWAVVVAAGTGQRMGSAIPKQYLSLHGRPMIEWSVERIRQVPDLREVVVVIAKEDQRWSLLPIATQVRTAVGGAARYISVLNGLLSLQAQAHDSDWVLIHDAARPCVRVEDIEKLIACCVQNHIGGILAMRSSNTIKLATGQTILRTLDREQIWHALTPQCFRYGEIKMALNRALETKSPITDEAAAMEYADIPISLVEGCSDNIKVTSPWDLDMAAYILQYQQRQPK